MALRFAERSAVRTPLAPTAAHQPVTLVISPHQGADARVCVHWVAGGMWRVSRFPYGPVEMACWCLQMWMSAGTDPFVVPMPCARTCPVPSSASVTKATRGHGMDVTAWVRDCRACGTRGGVGWTGPAHFHSPEET